MSAAPDPRDKNGPTPPRADPTEATKKQAHREAARKLYLAAKGHSYHFRKGSTSATARIDETGIWRVVWSPRIPKETPQGERTWIAYFQWRNEIAQEVVNRAGAELWLVDRIGTALTMMHFRPQAGGQS